MSVISEVFQSFSDNFFWVLLDIIVVSAALYALFAFLKKHRCTRLIKYVVLGIFVYSVVSTKFIEQHMALVGKIGGILLVLIVVGLCILFTQEIKRIIWKLSSPKEMKEMFTTTYNCSDAQLRKTIEEIVKACQNMSKKNVGALMIITPSAVPQNIVTSGTMLDSQLTCPLLECLFNTKAPLHDGAVFIKGDRIVAAGCFLPLTENTALDKELGTRHRAAVGITETNNVMAIVVSEESGVISVAMGGKIERYYDGTMLTDKLEQVYGLKAVVTDSKKNLFRRKS